MKLKKFRRTSVLALTLALCCGGIFPAFAAEAADSAPDSVLYYGRVEDISRDENGKMTFLHMSSDRYGEYVMLLSEDTVWIDSGNRAASDPASLKEGEGLYVFHSPVSTRSMPPQSTAFAIVRNVPQDASCARYHKVEAVEETDGTFRITTDNGGLLLLADKDTSLSSYAGRAVFSPTHMSPGKTDLIFFAPAGANSARLCLQSEDRRFFCAGPVHFSRGKLRLFGFVIRKRQIFLKTCLTAEEMRT